MVFNSIKVEPPFSFTYSRSDSAVKNKGNQESITVRDIKESKWFMKTAQEGTFRVTAINDRHCGYPRRVQSKHGANVILAENIA